MFLGTHLKNQGEAAMRSFFVPRNGGKMKRYFTTRVLAQQALITAVYVLLTLSGWGAGYGPIQFRYSEVLNWLAFYNPQHIVGLTLGCFLANIASPLGIIDMFAGTLGTFLAAWCMSQVKSRWIAALFPGLFSFIYALEAYFVGSAPLAAVPVIYGQIFLSEIIIVGIIGIPIMLGLERIEPLRRNLLSPAGSFQKRSHS